MTLSQALLSLDQHLDKILSPEITALVDSVSKPVSDKDSPYLVLPTGVVTITQSATLVAETSNKYAAATRLASIARAQYKIAEAAFKFKFRTSLGAGKNTAERESKAYALSSEEYDKMILLQAIVEVCEGIESSSRIASESARRNLLAMEQISKAETRFDGAADRFDLTPKDFSTT